MTFWEMLNTVRFRDIAGRVYREADLLPLRDILVQYQTSFLIGTNDAYSCLLLMGNHEAAEFMLDHTQKINTMIERDIVTIDVWIRARPRVQ